MLEIFNMALQNIRRRTLRNSLTIIGLAIFVLIFILVSSFTLTLQNTVSESLTNLGGEITIWSQDAPVPFISGIPENYTDLIKPIAYVKNVSPQITQISQVDTEPWRLTLGLNPSDIPLFYTYTMVEGTMIDANESKAVIGYLFADFLKKHVGNNITINGQTMAVVGIYKTETWIDNAVIVPFKVAQNIFSLAGRTSIIMITIANSNKIDFVINEIRKKLPNVSVLKSQEATAKLAPIMNSVTWVSNTLSTIAGVACFFGITNVILTGILERTKEIGILKALGAKGIDVAKMIIYESTVLGAFGGLMGCLVSLMIFIQGLLIPVTSTAAMRISVFPEVFIYGLILSVAISILAALYPLWRAVRVRPNEVLKFG